MKRSIQLTLDIPELKEIIKECLIETGKKQSPPENLQSDRLTQKQASKFLGVTQPTIIDWKKKGLIPYHQVSNTRRVYYLKSELMATTKKGGHQ